MRRIVCCARAASGHVAATPPSSVMNSRRLNHRIAFDPLQPGHFAGYRMGRDQSAGIRAFAVSTRLGASPAKVRYRLIMP
jgi:hypothetical protein